MNELRITQKAVKILTEEFTLAVEYFVDSNDLEAYYWGEEINIFCNSTQVDFIKRNINKLGGNVYNKTFVKQYCGANDKGGYILD